MASALDNNDGGPQSNRNLWIILGTVLGFLVVAFAIGGIWICRRRLQRRGLLPTRTVTPLDDAEFESWRRPSLHNSRQNRYTVMPRDRSSLEQMPDHYNYLLEKETLAQRPSTAPHPGTPPRSHRTSGRRQSSRTNSIQDRPPTPYSARGRPDSQECSSPSSITYPKRTHVHYPSVSEASEFDFEFEKFDLRVGSQPEQINRGSSFRRL